jgi:hypothetical protein
MQKNSRSPYRGDDVDSLPTAEIRYWQLLIWISSVINSMSMGFIP